PADLVAAFRGLTVLSQAALWFLVAGCFGWLRPRSDGRSAAEQREELLSSP
ncbi:cobalamin cluster protein, partial [Natrinema soli]